jgi:chromosome segregation ATPase
MATNMTDMVAEHWLEAEGFRPHHTNGKSENGAEREAAAQLALAPLVDKIAYGFARGLVVALKELENHIASETRKVGDSVGRRLDTLQASFQDLTGVVSEQRAVSLAVQEQCHELALATASLRESDTRQADELNALRTETKSASAEVSGRLDALGKELNAGQQEAGQRLDSLTAATAALQESDARQAGELTAFRNETREHSAAISERIDTLCRELGVQQEDVEAVKTTLGGLSTRVDSVVERLDRQADALRSIYSTYSQRETELEQLVDGLARLRSHAAPVPAKAL